MEIPNVFMVFLCLPIIVYVDYIIFYKEEIYIVRDKRLTFFVASLLESLLFIAGYCIGISK